MRKFLKEQSEENRSLHEGTRLNYLIINLGPKKTGEVLGKVTSITDFVPRVHDLSQVSIIKANVLLSQGRTWEI